VSARIDDRESSRFAIMATEPEEGQFSLRTDSAQVDVIGRMAEQRGMKRQHFAALVIAAACGLPRPSRCPAVPLDLNELKAEGQALFAKLQDQEGKVLSRTA
jgi:hypothetical protein